MATLTRSLKIITFRGIEVLFKIDKILIGLAVIGLGMLLGSLLSAPGETSQLTVSLLTVFVLVLIIVQKPLNGVLVWLFFMVFLESSINIPMGAGLPDLSFSRFAIAFLAVFMLARAAIGKFKFVTPVSVAEICILGTTIGIMISAPLADNPTNVLQDSISRYFQPLAIYFFTKNLVQNEKDLHKLLMTIAIFGFVAGTYAIYEYTTGNILFLSKDVEDVMLYRGDSGIRMIRGLLGGSGPMGRVLAMTIPITFYLLLERKRVDIQKALLAGMILIQAYGILIAMSRTPWYSLLIALFVMQFFYPQFRRLFIVIVFLAAIVLWATWDQVNESQAMERKDENSENFNGRTPRWEAGKNMWKEKPLRGWGFGRYGEESGRFRTDGIRRNFQAVENDYLHILVSCGLIGFVPYFLFLLTPLLKSIRLFFQARAPDWSGFIKTETLAVYWAVILCFLIGSYTAVQSESITKLLPFAVAGAVVGSHDHLLRKSKAKNRSRRESPLMVARAEETS